MTIPTLHTGRLILRAPRLSDLARMAEFFATSRSHMVGGPKDKTETFRSLISRIGHWSVLKDAEGQGFAAEAAIAARDYAAQHQNLNRIISYIAPENARSLSLEKRLGATLERNDMLLGTPCHVYRHPTRGVA